MSQIKVLVVDDSVFTRKRLVDMLASDSEIAVIDTAQNGLEAIEKVKSLRPDVVTLDIEMAGMDGLTALGHIMSECPTPVVMVSTLTEEGSEATAQALLEGAVDFIHKPTDAVGAKLYQVKDELIAKVKAASKARLKKLSSIAPSGFNGKASFGSSVASQKLVMIGTSTGGPRALMEVLPRLPKNFPSPIVVVQHMPQGPFIKSIAKRIDNESNIRVEEAQNNDRLEPGVALIAPGGCHILIEKGGIVKFNHGPAVNSVKPSVDVMMGSGAAIYGPNSVGVILTGMGADGAKGMELIKLKGGRTIAEHESTCVVYGMPKAVIESGHADEVVPLDQIPQEIVKAVGEKNNDYKLHGQPRVQILCK
ncbi:MAG: chemotaxis response regulator protein-glutamate methylesterase [Actinomycetota bacterium]